MYYNIEELSGYCSIIKNSLINYDYNRPFIISIEGNDRSGKSTFINIFKEFIINNKYDFDIEFIKFPREENVNIKKIINEYGTLSNAENNIELYKLFHFDIYSFKFNNKIYIIDRYNLSSIVYSKLRNVNINKIININKEFNLIEPNIIFYFNRVFNRTEKNICEFDEIESINKQIKLYNDELNNLLKQNKYINIYNKNNILIYKLI